MALTTIRLLKVMPLLGVDGAAKWVGPLEQAMAAYDIATDNRVTMFLANIAHESRELTAMEENLHYSAAGLLHTWPKRFDADSAAHYAAAGPAAIAACVYAGRLGNGDEASGDGWLYRGRGPNGLTFHDNYRACGQAVCGDSDVLVTHPEFIMDAEFGAASAAWFWAAHGCSGFADAGDFDGVCDAINIGHKTISQGDSNGYAARLEYLVRARVAWGLQ